MTKIVTSFLVFTILCISACQIDEVPNENTLINVEDEFVVSMWEELGSTDRIFQFVVKTISQQDCTNTLINFSKERQDLSLSFSLNNIQVPEACDPGQAPASANIFFPNLEPISYNVSIKLKETIVNYGTLTVTSAGYTLKMDTEIGFRVANDQLFKVFDQTIWGFVSYTNPDHTSLANTAIQEIANISEVRAYQMGNYGYFSVIDQNNTLAPTTPINDHYDSFIFQYPGELSNLKAKLEELRAAHEQLNFTVYTATGEQL